MNQSTGFESQALEVLRDQGGAVTLGWVGKGVYYARFSGGLSVTLGLAHVTRIEDVLATVPSLAYFSDASALLQYDLLARSAFVRLILGNRKKFSSLVMLTWQGGVTAATEAFVAAIGGNVTIVRDVDEFDLLLTKAAPLSRHVIERHPTPSPRNEPMTTRR